MHVKRKQQLLLVNNNVDINTTVILTTPSGSYLKSSKTNDCLKSANCCSRRNSWTCEFATKTTLDSKNKKLKRRKSTSSRPSSRSRGPVQRKATYSTKRSRRVTPQPITPTLADMDTTANACVLSSCCCTDHCLKDNDHCLNVYTKYRDNECSIDDFSVRCTLGKVRT